MKVSARGHGRYLLEKAGVSARACLRSRPACIPLRSCFQASHRSPYS